MKAETKLAQFMDRYFYSRLRDEVTECPIEYERMYAKALKGVFEYTLKLMKSCKCGGKDGDSSCYSCLRNYGNQKYHDLLKRKYVIDFIGQFL